MLRQPDAFVLLIQQSPVKGPAFDYRLQLPCKTIGLIGRSKILRDSAGAFILMPLLTHGRFHEQPQRRRRSRPHGSECSSSVGGTSLSLERNLGNRKRPHSPNNQGPGWRSAHSHAALMIEVENYPLMWHFELSCIWCNCSHCEGLDLFVVLWCCQTDSRLQISAF